MFPSTSSLARPCAGGHITSEPGGCLFPCGVGSGPCLQAWLAHVYNPPLGPQLLLFVVLLGGMGVPGSLLDLLQGGWSSGAGLPFRTLVLVCNWGGGCSKFQGNGVLFFWGWEVLQGCGSCLGRLGAMRTISSGRRDRLALS